MDGLLPFDIDEEEAIEKLERLWAAHEQASEAASQYLGSLNWKTTGGQDYLVHTLNLRYEGNRQRVRSLGGRSKETERRKADFDDGRERTRAELDTIRRRLDVHARVLKALRLGRVSPLTARFLRELQDEGFDGGHFRIGGGAALAAYEVGSRTRIPAPVVTGTDFDLLPTELFVRDRSLFDAIASRKIFGPAELDGDRLVLARGIALRVLSDEVQDDWVRHMRYADAEEGEIDAVRWAFEVPEAIPLLAIGLDGSPAPVAALDPRAFAILAASQARYFLDPPATARLETEAAVAARVAASLAPEPFERSHLALFPQLADAISDGGVDDGTLVMRP